MDAIKLAVEPRTETGKGAARKLRRAGLVPAVLYRDGAEPALFGVNPKELDLSLRRTANRNTLFSLEIGGQTRACLIKEFQRHPVSRRFLHVDFYEVLEDSELVVAVRVEPVGRAEGTKLGGTMQVLRRTLDVRCLPADIPESIKVDVTPLEVGDLIRVSAIEPPAKATLLFEIDFNVVTVVGKRVEEEEIEDEEDEEGEEGEGTDEESESQD